MLFLMISLSVTKYVSTSVQKRNQTSKANLVTTNKLMIRLNKLVITNIGRGKTI